ncbi:MAG: VOC family protein [Hyphomicrobiaceae bacterium]
MTAMTHKSRLAAFVIDCNGPEIDRAAEFWSAALGCPIVADAAHPNYRLLVTPDDQVKLLIQSVDHDSRIHLDIETDDRDAEVARLEALGARRLATVKRWIKMEAPTGHRFCVVNPQRTDFADKAKSWDRT